MLWQHGRAYAQDLRERVFAASDTDKVSAACEADQGSAISAGMAGGPKHFTNPFRQDAAEPRAGRACYSCFIWAEIR